MNLLDIEEAADKPKPVAFEVRWAIVPIEDIKGRIIRNPSYNNTDVGIYGWGYIPEVSQARKPQFMAALAASIKEDGIRNPVVVYGVPDGLYLSFGGSRVLAAAEAGETHIPAIINDYSGRYHGYDEVTPDNWETFFKDIPKYAEFTDTGFDTHYFMERNRRGDCDPAGYAWMPEDATWVEQEFPWLTK